METSRNWSLQCEGHLPNETGRASRTNRTQGLINPGSRIADTREVLAVFTSRSISDGTKPDGPLGCPYL